QYAALSILNPVWSALQKRLESAPPPEIEAKPDEEPKKKRRKKKRKRRSGFVGELTK
ncbi:hypothetical protein LCGC14_1891390, partial [marine sediment metagenome]